MNDKNRGFRGKEEGRMSGLVDGKALSLDPKKTESWEEKYGGKEKRRR